MPKDEKLKETIETNEVLAAIKAVKEKGWDINPFTVAEVAGIEPFLISRSAEFMRLVIDARGGDVAFHEQDNPLEDGAVASVTGASNPTDLAGLDRLLNEIPQEQPQLSGPTNYVIETSLQAFESTVNSNNRQTERQAHGEIKQAIQSNYSAPVESSISGNSHEDRTLPSQDLEDELLNEQVKALLSSESEEQVKRMEQELEQAYVKIAELEDETRDLNRSIIGLEKVNEALNVRMRELETQVRARNEDESKKAAAEQLETLNQQLSAKAAELSAENRELAMRLADGHVENEQLKFRISEHEALVLELEGKLSELQQEADNLALQLQNAFHVGYQRGIADAAQQLPANAVQEAQAYAEETGQYSDQAEQYAQESPPYLQAGDEPHQTADGSDPAPSNVQVFPEHTGVYEAYTPPAGQTQVENARPYAGLSQNDVRNFAQTGPYVESQFNALESLTWRDLETVYSMGVLSVKDISQNLDSRVLGSARPERTDDEDTLETPLDAYTGDPAAMGQTLSYTNLEALPAQAGQHEMQGHGEFQEPSGAESRKVAPPPPPPKLKGEGQRPHFQPPTTMPALEDLPKSEGLDFINPNDVLDLDKLDIFENLEELEELGQIDVIAGPLPEEDGMSQVGIQTGDTPPVSADSLHGGVSNDELRELIKSRIQQAKEHVVEQTVRTPPAPESETDQGKGKPQTGYVGLKKFVGQKAAPQPGAPQPEERKTTLQPGMAIPTKAISPEVRRACGLLGLRPEDCTKELVTREWKKQAAAVHPDLGGDQEMARELNQAKEILLRWLDQTTPKLGNKFGKRPMDKAPPDKPPEK